MKPAQGSRRFLFAPGMPGFGAAGPPCDAEARPRAATPRAPASFLNHFSLFVSRGLTGLLCFFFRLGTLQHMMGNLLELKAGSSYLALWGYAFVGTLRFLAGGLRGFGA